jgi:hypothetical protein
MVSSGNRSRFRHIDRLFFFLHRLDVVREQIVVGAAAKLVLVHDCKLEGVSRIARRIEVRIVE